MLNSVSILFLSAHLMQVQLLLVTFNLNGGLHAISIEKPSENHPYLETVSTDVKFLDDSVFLKTESEPNFGFLHIPTWNVHKACCFTQDRCCYCHYYCDCTVGGLLHSK